MLPSTSPSSSSSPSTVPPHPPAPHHRPRARYTELSHHQYFTAPNQQHPTQSLPTPPDSLLAVSSLTTPAMLPSELGFVLPRSTSTSSPPVDHLSAWPSAPPPPPPPPQPRAPQPKRDSLPRLFDGADGADGSEQAMASPSSRPVPLFPPHPPSRLLTDGLSLETSAHAMHGFSALSGVVDPAPVAVTSASVVDSGSGGRADDSSHLENVGGTLPPRVRKPRAGTMPPPLVLPNNTSSSLSTSVQAAPQTTTTASSAVGNSVAATASHPPHTPTAGPPPPLSIRSSRRSSEPSVSPFQRALVHRLASSSELPVGLLPPTPEDVMPALPTTTTMMANLPARAALPLHMHPAQGAMHSATLSAGGTPAPPSVLPPRAIATTDVRGTVIMANDRFAQLVVSSARPTVIPSTPRESPRTGLLDPNLASASSFSSMSSSSSSSSSTSAISPPGSTGKKTVRKGFVVFNPAAADGLAVVGSPPRTASPIASAVASRENSAGNPAPAAAAPPARIIGSQMLEWLAPGYREKIVEKMQVRMGDLGGDIVEDVVVVAGRIVRIQPSPDAPSVPVTLWVKLKAPLPPSSPSPVSSPSSIKSFSSFMSTASTSTMPPSLHPGLDKPVLLWIMEEVREVTLTARYDPYAGAMVSSDGPWDVVFPHAEHTPSGKIVVDAVVGGLAQDDMVRAMKLESVRGFTPAPSTPTNPCVTAEWRHRFYTASDSTGTAFPVVVMPPPPPRPSSSSQLPLSSPSAGPPALTLLVLPHLAGMITAADDGTVLAIHPGLAKHLLGWSAKDLVGDPINRILPQMPAVIQRLAARAADTDATHAHHSPSHLSPKSPIVEEEGIGAAAVLSRAGAGGSGPVVSAVTVRRMVAAMESATTRTQTQAGGDGTGDQQQQLSLDSMAPRRLSPSRGRGISPSSPTAKSPPPVANPTKPTGMAPVRGAGVVYCVHRDGGRIACDVQVRPLATLGGRRVFSLWVVFDHATHRWPLPLASPADANGGATKKTTSPLASSSMSSMSALVSSGALNSGATTTPTVAAAQSPPMHHFTGLKKNRSAADYETEHQMGEGAYGTVAMARDKISGARVALKLIDKDRIVPDAWTRRKPYGVVPREIAILADLAEGIAGTPARSRTGSSAGLLLGGSGGALSASAAPAAGDIGAAVTATLGESSMSGPSGSGAHFNSANSISSSVPTSYASLMPSSSLRNGHYAGGTLVHSSSMSMMMDVDGEDHDHRDHEAGCENVVRMVGFWETEREFGLEMAPHGEGVDLFDYIEQTRGLTEAVARSIFYQVCQGIEYLHRRHIVHRDIKDENVILDASLRAVLVDFGSAAYARSEKPTFDTFAGTLEYCAPELIMGRRYQGKPQDVWALGVLLYVMLFRECPFFNDDEILRRAVHIPQQQQRATAVSEDAALFLKFILHKDAARRPTIEEVLMHAWFDPIRAGAST